MQKMFFLKGCLILLSSGLVRFGFIQTESMPNFAAPTMSSSQESPTNSVSLGSISRELRATEKMSGAGFLIPTSSEIMIEENKCPSFLLQDSAGSLRIIKV